ncbi:MAG: Flp pilus assembly complex ATPase component TadA [Ardenticatenaceae bacterium]|nr:Flp pilus assembly complex ATPase component TadA [Ardenticatenaceae bacterium]MCB8947264.1 Flp pilus assembly complex ATPase component TadA [Ardenticatenaceae bacterium]
MADVLLPFPEERIDYRKIGRGDSFLPGFPQPLREVAMQKPYLAAYLTALPVDEIGIPEFYPTPDRSLGKLERRNLIYPIRKGNFIHIYPDEQSERDYYIVIEPTLGINLNGLSREIELKLLDMAEEIGETDEEDRESVFMESLDKILTVKSSKNGKSKDRRLQVNPLEMEAIRYTTKRDKIGVGALDPLLNDEFIEDISCSGIGPIFLEHKLFKSLKTSIVFSNHEQLDAFVVWLGERIKQPVTLRNPIVDSVLPDGSRINIVYGRDITKRGSNFTIRKFAEEPLNILKLIDFGGITSTMAAYLWLAIEDDLNVFVSGETASGKTTLLNALTTFIKPDAKIVTIEDTPELQVPQENWLREVVKNMGADDQGASVTMFDLLKAALRQRPNRIMIGEIRGEEGNIAFGAMQTGHGVMATFHASSVEKLIQRLTGAPILVPKTYVPNLDLVVIQMAVRGPNGNTLRRILSINEIVDYDPSTNSFSYITAFRWRPDDDTFEFPAYMNSFLLEEKVARMRGYTEQNKRKIYDDLNKRARILEKLGAQKIGGFKELFNIMTEARRQGLID